MICVSINETDIDRCIKETNNFELCEIRIDLCNFSIQNIQKVFSSHKNLIATCRPLNNIDEKTRLKFLETAIESGAKYVDIEYESEYTFKQQLISKALQHNCAVIISYHNYDHTPPYEQLKIIVRQSFDMGANIVKIACMVQKPEDNAKILSLYQEGKRIVAIGMGELGKISRIAAPLLGAEFTFASANDEKSTAPGQISYYKLHTIIELLKNS